MLGPYGEMGVTVAASHKAGDGRTLYAGYYPYMYLTQDAAIDAGRVLGFPKKEAFIRVLEHGGAPDDGYGVMDGKNCQTELSRLAFASATFSRAIWMSRLRPPASCSAAGRSMRETPFVKTELVTTAGWANEPSAGPVSETTMHNKVAARWVRGRFTFPPSLSQVGLR